MIPPTNFAQASKPKLARKLLLKKQFQRESIGRGTVGSHQQTRDDTFKGGRPVKQTSRVLQGGLAVSRSRIKSSKSCVRTGV